MIKLKNLIKEVDDDQMIKYKDKDGKPAEMKAGSAKMMEKDHLAKQAWDKIQDSEKGGEEGKPKGADLFKTKEIDKTDKKDSPIMSDPESQIDDTDDMVADMNNSEDMAMEYEAQIETGGDFESATFDDFDTKGNPIYTAETADGEEVEITVDQETGEIWDYDSDKSDRKRDGAAYGNVNDSYKSSKFLLETYKRIGGK